uniref:Uncharacterized protein n=1 Tax=Anopheles atroparvus TaxID=41427 RepID=A0AAG5DIZ8_ANOAO
MLVVKCNRCVNTALDASEGRRYVAAGYAGRVRQPLEDGAPRLDQTVHDRTKVRRQLVQLGSLQTVQPLGDRLELTKYVQDTVRVQHHVPSRVQASTGHSGHPSRHRKVRLRACRTEPYQRADQHGQDQRIPYSFHLAQWMGWFDSISLVDS